MCKILTIIIQKQRADATAKALSTISPEADATDTEVRLFACDIFRFYMIHNN